MAGAVTNRGKHLINSYVFSRVDSLPTNFHFYLALSSATPTVDTNTWSELNQVATGNGYPSDDHATNGEIYAANATNFTVIGGGEDDTNDWDTIVIKDLVWTASGGPIPSSPPGARWLVMTDDNVTPGSREVICYWDLVTERTVSDTQTLTMDDPSFRSS